MTPSAIRNPQSAILQSRAEDAFVLARLLLYPEDAAAGPAASIRTLGDPGRGVSQAVSALDIEGFRAEHRRVFAPTLNADAPPYEGFYGVENVFQLSEELADLQGFYRAFGLAPRSGERADHAAVETAFYGFLLAKEAAAESQEHEETARSARRRFLEDHLGRWIPAFAELLRRKAGAGVFAALADALEEFVRAECERSGAAPKVLRDLDLRVPRPEAAETISCFG